MGVKVLAVISQVVSPCFCHCLGKKYCFLWFTQNKAKSKLVTNKPDLSARARNGRNWFRIVVSDSEGEDYSGFEKTETLLTSSASKYYLLKKACNHEGCFLVGNGVTSSGQIGT